MNELRYQALLIDRNGKVVDEIASNDDAYVEDGFESLVDRVGKDGFEALLKDGSRVARVAHRDHYGKLIVSGTGL
jgi:hypothetical protein